MTKKKQHLRYSLPFQPEYSLAHIVAEVALSWGTTAILVHGLHLPAVLCAVLEVGEGEGGGSDIGKGEGGGGVGEGEDVGEGEGGASVVRGRVPLEGG